ncbi:TonB family protein [Spirosoma sp. KCTC 42546]|uniref:TonB family protein n=1 Tax=Spirosoma sp. KCTC 42546 TaxID=2520506 RepID=UPI0011593629|nr:TonB family protein [Spirosoma sp. KCTC 42546]QDK78084.1 TonB family protein [Spirosoma sp. KCTC 42546]
MRFWLLLPFLFFFSSVIAQQTAYQQFEVDTVAEPRGGISFLKTFIQTNFRKPVLAEAKGIGGRIIISAIVEINGSVSDVKLMNSIRPDCDREAARVFGLFNAWKPAQKDGHAVRQQVTFPVTFKPNTPFAYMGGARIDYFGSDGKPVLEDSSRAAFKRVTPMDTNGIPSGDVSVYEMKNKNWKEYFRLLLIRKKSGKHNISNKQLYAIGTQNYNQFWEGEVFVLDEMQKLVSLAYYENGKRAGSELNFHLNGAVAEKNEEMDGKSTNTTWYTNGQIKQIKTVGEIKALVQNEPEQVTAYWDSTGHQKVKDGNGYAIYQTRVRSKSDTVRHTLFIEQGAYKNGFKHGNWTGRYIDNSYFFEEQYDKGVCQFGKARVGEGDTVRYSVLEKQPEFPGGLQGLGEFLSNNLQYPRKAQQAGAEGKVFVSFVVCTDGTLCDYEVLKSVHPDLDKEAVRVVQKMSGRWKPGFQRGQKVRVKYNLPINFSLY